MINRAKSDATFVTDWLAFPDTGSVLGLFCRRLLPILS